MTLNPQAKFLLDQMAAHGHAAHSTSRSRRPCARRTACHRRFRAPRWRTSRTAAIPRPGGDIPVRIYQPTNATDHSLLVWYHGGGWVIGDLDGADVTCRELAARGGSVVVSVDYRLAPESRYPAAHEDCYAATVWAAEHAAELGADASKLAVGGDSAGGNLAAVVSLRARDEDGPAIGFQLLVYPVTDHDYGTDSYRDNADGYLLTRDGMVWFWDHYLGPRRRRVASPRLPAARGGSLGPAAGARDHGRVRPSAGRGRGVREAPAGGGRGRDAHALRRPDSRLLRHARHPRRRHERRPGVGGEAQGGAGLAGCRNRPDEAGNSQRIDQLLTPAYVLMGRVQDCTARRLRNC